jgi:superfamily I DNA/RNA helicase
MYSPEELESVCVCSASTKTLELFEKECAARARPTIRLTGRKGFAAPGIKVSTLEHVKGFEFEKVFLLDLSDSILPSRGLPFEERWRDAFQIYVAMTRARDELVMSYVYNPSILLAPLKDAVTEHRATEWLSSQ